MEILYVAFNNVVTLEKAGGDVSYWSRDKHGSMTKIEEKGSWILITIGQISSEMKDGKETREWKATGVIVRVPITNVAYIRSAPSDKAKV